MIFIYLIAFIVLVIAVKEVEHTEESVTETKLDTKEKLGSRFWMYIAVVFLFTLGNSTDAFLLLRANQLGIAVALAPILWAFLNFVKAALGTWGGTLSDRFGRKPLIIAGWTIYALVYLGFAFATKSWHGSTWPEVQPRTTPSLPTRSTAPRRTQRRRAA